MKKRRDGGDDGTWDPDCAAAAAAAIVEICGCCCPSGGGVSGVSGVWGTGSGLVCGCSDCGCSARVAAIGVQSGVIGGTWNVRLNERVVYVYVCGCA